MTKLHVAQRQHATVQVHFATEAFSSALGTQALVNEYRVCPRFRIRFFHLKPFLIGMKRTADTGAARQLETGIMFGEPCLAVVAGHPKLNQWPIVFNPRLPAGFHSDDLITADSNPQLHENPGRCNLSVAKPQQVAQFCFDGASTYTRECTAAWPVLFCRF